MTGKALESRYLSLEESLLLLRDVSHETLQTARHLSLPGPDRSAIERAILEGRAQRKKLEEAIIKTQSAMRSMRVELVRSLVEDYGLTITSVAKLMMVSHKQHRLFTRKLRTRREDPCRTNSNPDLRCAVVFDRVHPTGKGGKVATTTDPSKRPLLLARLLAIALACLALAAVLAWGNHVSLEHLVLDTGLLVGLVILTWFLDAIARRLRNQADMDGDHLGLVEDSFHGWAWTIDREGHFIDAGEGVSRILGWPSDYFAGKDLLEVFSPIDESQETDLACLAARRRGWDGVKTLVTDREGRIRIIEKTSAPLLDPNGELIGWRGFSRDVSTSLVTPPEVVEGRQEVEGIIRADQLRIVFQPIFDLVSGRVVGAEALSRFETLPARPPDEWFKIAAETGLGEELEFFALRKALSRLSSLPKGTYLAINVSPSVIVHASLLGYLSRVDGRRIVLELTEHQSIAEQRYPAIRDARARLTEAGVRLAIDDAGAGFATLNHVLELDPDVIKLDRSMVKRIEVDPSRQALAASLALFAQQTGANVVAEGIESRDQLTALVRAGIRFGQGFALGKSASLPLASSSSLALTESTKAIRLP